MLNNKGFSTKEVLASLLILILFVIFISQSFAGTFTKNSFFALELLSDKFFSAATIMQNKDVIYSEVIYLADLLKEDKNIKKDYKSPFSNNVCDKYESKIYEDDEEKKLILKCDNYIIENINNKNKKFNINLVGDWIPEEEYLMKTELDSINVEKETFYSLDDHIKDFYIEKEFIEKYNKLKNANFLRVKDIKKVIKVLEKTYYRTSDFIEER